MEDSEGQKMFSLGPEPHKLEVLKNQSDLTEDGTPARYHVKPTTDSHDQSQPYRKITFGERETNITNKTHKNILLVGETGTGKTKMINTMINYMLGVKREDKVWFEITDDQSNESVHSQTSIITVYGFYLRESPIHLTIIDTPGYGDTRGVDHDKQITENLNKLIESEEISEIDAVCLVIKSTQNRLSDKQMYIFDAVQSLFGRDLAENIVLLFTHSRGAIPKNVLMAVEEGQIKCAVNEQNQPVYFMFDNSQSNTTDEEAEMMQGQSWNISFKEMKGFYKFLENTKPKSLKMTRDVLQQREQFEAKITAIQTHIQEKEEKLKTGNTKDLEQNKEQVKDKNNSETEDDVPDKISCPVFEETCQSHCWLITPLNWCNVMTDDHCTKCTNNCHYSRHVKGANLYETKNGEKTKRKGTKRDSKKDSDDKIVQSPSVNKTQEDEDLNKVKLVMDAFHCVNTLQMFALNTDSLIVLLHIDLLIEKLKEIDEPEKAETLENIKRRAGGEKHRALEYMKMCVTSKNQKF